MAARCFRYNTQLVLQYGAPVLTTVLYLFPPGPRHEPVFRVVIGGREINRWVFEEICLLEMDAQAMLARGDPGLLALVPLMRGADLDVLTESARRIESTGRSYTVSELARVVGRDRIWQQQSSLYVEGKAEGKAEGVAEGRLADAREFCTALARKHHPTVFHRVEGVIVSCNDPARLKEWAIAASDLSDAEFVALLGA